jgi:hypothetical protein
MKYNHLNMFGLLQTVPARYFFYVCFSFIVVGLGGCLKGEFDTPPTGGNDPEIASNQIVSLTEVMATYYIAGKYTPIDLDKYVQAVVVANDKSGNFYKTIIVEDENSDLGIALLIDENEIHSSYPVGRRVFVKLKGLTISDYNGLPQLGMGVDNSGTSPRLGYIPGTLLPEVVLQGKYGLPVTPRIRKITELSPSDINTLVRIEGVQFASVGSGITYANGLVDPPVTINQDLVDCANNKIIVRNSGYSDFANALLPQKNGTLTAVYSVFRTDKQLFVRDTNDVNFTLERCGGTSGSQVSIQDLRAQYTGTSVTLSSGFVKGIVISDIANKNINSQNMVVQDGTYGIVLRFKSAISVPLGSEVKVGLTGGSLGEYQNLLQVDKLENTNVEVLATGKSVTPKILSISQIDFAKDESTLVKIANASLSGGTKYSDKLKIKDATGELELFTFAAATFGSTAIKTGSVTVTAIVSEFGTTKQLTIRKIEDVEGGAPCDVSVASLDCDGDGVNNGLDCDDNNKDIYPGAPCDDGNSATVNDKYDDQCACKGSAPGNGIDESFSSQANNIDINIQGWVNAAVKGTRKWQGKLFSGNTYAQATAFNDTNPDMETWLITPEITTATTPSLSFETAKAFWVHDGLSVWVTTSYTGDPATTTWTQVNARIAQKDDADNTFIPSGNVDLLPLGPKVRVGFKYVGKGGTNTSTYRIDNVKVK